MKQTFGEDSKHVIEADFIWAMKILLVSAFKTSNIQLQTYDGQIITYYFESGVLVNLSLTINQQFHELRWSS